MNKNVVYTAIFGGYDNLTEPSVIPDGWDFVCFTDSDIKSEVWDVRKITPLYEDSTRNARKYKVLPHRFLSEYNVSIWVDGNILIRDNLTELVDDYLQDCNIAMMNHNKNILDPRDCIYDEAETIMYFGKKNGNYKDNPTLITNQMDRYKKQNYPINNGLAVTMEVLRRHNEQDVIDTMNIWWNEIKYNSKRDQLSFNYSAWKTNLNFKWMDGDSRDNKHFLNMGKHKKKINTSTQKYEPINLDYFLNMEVANGGGGKEIVNQNYTLKKVKDIIEFYSNKDNINKTKKSLNPKNWQYFNCMLAEFRKDVGDHHELGWDKMTEDYYKSLDLMSDDELKIFLMNNPVEFDNGFIRHSYHRACAMIGRLINGGKYIPFYMKKEQIYNEPRKKDGIQRRFPLFNSVKCLKLIEELKIPRGEFTICQSGILALMGIRQNDDLDIIISSEARKQLFNGNQQFMRFNGGIEIFEPNKSKFRYFGAQGDDDLIDNYSFQVDGYNFLEPRFYFSRKRKDREKDLKDWAGIKRFFKMENDKGYPFNNLTYEKWGKKWVSEDIL